MSLECGDCICISRFLAAIPRGEKRCNLAPGGAEKSESEQPSCPSESGSGLHFPETLARTGPTLHSPAGPSASGEGEVPGEQPRSWGLV